MQLRQLCWCEWAHYVALRTFSCQILAYYLRFLDGRGEVPMSPSGSSASVVETDYEAFSNPSDQLAGKGVVQMLCEAHLPYVP